MCDRVKAPLLMQRSREPSACMPDLIVKTGIQDALDDNNVAADFYAALDEEVAELLEDAARRAEANGRKTVELRDL